MNTPPPSASCGQLFRDRSFVSPGANAVVRRRNGEPRETRTKPGWLMFAVLLCWPWAVQGQGYAVRAWGDNSGGQLNIPLDLTNAVAVAGGLQHSLALKTDGTVIGWGDDSHGQIGVPAEATNVVSIAAGYYHSLALRADGTVLGWGDDANGQITIPAEATNVSAIAAGPNTSLALRADGTVIGWGQNQYGQTNGAAAGTGVTAIDCGYHGLALSTNGIVSGWGFDFWGQADGMTAGSNVVAIAAGVNHSLALKSNGTVAAWGRNLEGQTNVPAGLADAIAVAAGLEHSVVLHSTGRVTAWGRNLNGETNVPMNLSNVVAIAAGISHSLALTTDQPVYPIPVTQVEVLPRLKITATPGVSYEVQFQDTLVPGGDWMMLDTLIPVSNPTFYDDASTASQSRRFYRLASTNDPAVLDFLIAARLTLEAGVGRDYRLEYRDSGSLSTNWLLLTVVSITNNPQFYYDNLSGGKKLRVYQLIETNAP